MGHVINVCLFVLLRGHLDVLFELKTNSVVHCSLLVARRPGVGAMFINIFQYLIMLIKWGGTEYSSSSEGRVVKYS